MDVHATAPPGQAMNRLVLIMDRLLAPGGCPWDREQTLETLRPFLIEETYEVLDALARGDVAGHLEELGDLLMQVVFQAALRREQGAFDFNAVANAISDKLVRRHPHVFGGATGVETPAEVLAQWEQIKAAEKAAAGAKTGRILDGVKPAPALARAQKIGTKAAKVGFDWPSWDGSYDKIREEVDEVGAAVRAGDRAAIHHELGDLLFAVVNLARKLDVDAENALVDATARFQRRFERVEDGLAARGKTPRESTLEEMDALWNEAKRSEAQKK
jgi:tetrapyrrole methylase family protein / MazG family protein